MLFSTRSIQNEQEQGKQQCAMCPWLLQRAASKPAGQPPPSIAILVHQCCRRCALIARALQLCVGLQNMLCWWTATASLTPSGSCRWAGQVGSKSPYVTLPAVIASHRVAGHSTGPQAAGRLLCCNTY